MSSFTGTISKNVTKEAHGAANSMLQKLAKKARGEGDDVSTVTFPANLENQAQATYMAIYIFENVNNSKTFSTNVFDSDVDEDSYEIGAITWLKDQAQDTITSVKTYAKNQVKAVAQTAEDWLNRQKDALKEETKGITIMGADLKESADWVNKYLIPHRKKSESSALRDTLDPTKHWENGYRLEQAIHIQMPSSNITYKYENGWESTDTSTLNTIKTLIEGVKNIFGNDKDRQQAKQQLGSVVDRIKNAVGDVLTGGGVTTTRQSQQRQVYNPVIVFNYTVPTPRTFSYSFQLYPRNKEELYVLFNMIQMLKFYALPEVAKSAALGGGGSRPMTFNYPAKFAIKFFTNGHENKWFPKTLALGLTSIEETLTGDGGDMAFFENYFDTNSGNPPRIVNLTLTFKELGIMSRQAANEGY